MTETTARIRWDDDHEGDVPHFTGRAGTIDADLFKIWPPNEQAPEWFLTSELPGQGYAYDGSGRGELEARAEELLAEFAVSLVAEYSQA
jgi:hypothetical protein